MKKLSDVGAADLLELNGAFFALLEALGFAIARIGAGVKIDDGFTPDLDHMALIVTLDQPYLVDVGFGDRSVSPCHCMGKPELT